MEQIYLQVFKINMLKSSEQLATDFVHVINEDSLALKIAEEMIVRDLMKSWELQSEYERLIIW